jgi:dimethylhistidine N-methyltransferase
MITARVFTRQQSRFTRDTGLQEILDGLTQTPKRLPAKLFYDARGSALFEQICELDEYYLTRTELEILATHINEIAARIGPHRILLEYGSGASLKTRLLLDALELPAAYIPIDICESALAASHQVLSKSYPQLPIWPVCGDYTGELELPLVSSSGLVVGFFPGSTIGNLDHPAAVEFLQSARGHCGPRGKLLIGVDLRKDEATLRAAYDDSQGITTQFNLNMLRVLNRDYGTHFRLEDFAHRAVWNEAESRIEMHLVSRCRQTVRVGSLPIRFEAGESIVTEHCHKYTLDQFERLCTSSGFQVEQVWIDSRERFSVQLLAAETPGQPELEIGDVGPHRDSSASSSRP